MRSVLSVAAILVPVVLSLAAAAFPSVATAGQEYEPLRSRIPASSSCLSRCVELKSQCDEFEKLYPSCSTIDICIEEKSRCEAQCRRTTFTTGSDCGWKCGPRPHSISGAASHSHLTAGRW